MAVRVEGFLLRGDVGHIDVGADVHSRLAGAHDALHEGLHLLGDALLDLGLAAVGLGGHAGVATREGLGVLVDDRDAVGLQIRHRAGHQVLDGAHLVGARLAAADAQAHRGGRLVGVLLEQLALGQHQVHPCGGDAVQAHDGAAEFALQGALAVKLLDEVRLAHRAGIVEDLVADAGGGRQTLGRQHQARRGDLVPVHQDGRAVALHLILDVPLVQRLGDRAGFLEVEVGIEQGLGLAQAGGDGE